MFLMIQEQVPLDFAQIVAVQILVAQVRLLEVQQPEALELIKVEQEQLVDQLMRMLLHEIAVIVPVEVLEQYLITIVLHAVAKQVAQLLQELVVIIAEQELVEVQLGLEVLEDINLQRVLCLELALIVVLLQEAQVLIEALAQDHQVEVLVIEVLEAAQEVVVAIEVQEVALEAQVA